MIAEIREVLGRPGPEAFEAYYMPQQDPDPDRRLMLGRYVEEHLLDLDPDRLVLAGRSEAARRSSEESFSETILGVKHRPKPPTHHFLSQCPSRVLWWWTQLLLEHTRLCCHAWVTPHSFQHPRWHDPGGRDRLDTLRGWLEGRVGLNPHGWSWPKVFDSSDPDRLGYQEWFRLQDPRNREATLDAAEGASRFGVWHTRRLEVEDPVQSHTGDKEIRMQWYTLYQQLRAWVVGDPLMRNETTSLHLATNAGEPIDMSAY